MTVAATLEPTAPPPVQARDVFKIYQEGAIETVALRGADLVLARGEFVSLVGPSGSGKTTLLSILSGLAVPSAGEVLIDGEDLGHAGEARRAQLRAKQVGLVFQDANLIPFLTVEDNVGLVLRRTVPRRTLRRRARELLDELGVGDRAQHRPNQVSGGERQRVAIAVALANDPSVLLADEITGELDSDSAARVLELLSGLRRERALTMLLVTHNPTIAACADRQLVIADGLVREQ